MMVHGETIIWMAKELEKRLPEEIPPEEHKDWFEGN